MINKYNMKCSTTLSEACVKDGVDGMPTFPHYGFSEDATLYQVCPNECPEGINISHPL